MAYSPLYSFTLITVLLFISNNTQAVDIQKVTVEPASSLLFYPEKKATALVKPINHTQVPAQISAQVSTINVQLGNIVTKGQVLVDLDCQDKAIYLAKQASQFKISKAKLHLAKRNYDRAVTLKKNRHIGEAELDASDVDVTVAKENVEQVLQEKASATLAVQRCQVRSPFDGVVTQRMVSQGDYVNIGQSLITVLEQNNIEIEAQIPLDQIDGFIQAGQYHFINDEQKHLIVMKSIVGFIESNSRSQVVTFSLDEMNKPLDVTPKVLAGMNGMVSWQSKRSFLPAHLLTQRKGRYGIFVTEKKDNLLTAKFIALPQAQEGRPFELVMEKDQQIIVDGRHRVSAGKLISVKADSSNTKNKYEK